MSVVVVYRNRTTIVTADLGADVSADTFAAEIRATAASSSTLLATWAIDDAESDQGILTLTLDNADADELDAVGGWMDLKRITGGEPLSAFDEPLQVVFRDMPTA